ncbi:Sister chromatid cohesion protein pds5 [Smittium culicis]|uniref:Sister chromatid cohesion protein pds5 n=1 Tax=Smittium culicis TaxID=133412 RepID=A0A1R1XR22_9FUNG|nr:Sister chromatid cohesion protein pds5 [Smittium culicis]
MDAILTSLTFKPSLFQKENAKKLISTQDLLPELKKITKELSIIDQESVDTRSLTSVAKQLISNKITDHQNHSVQAYAACCLVDILRLFAPEAPYNNQELDVSICLHIRIFRLFIVQLKHLKSTSDPLYSKSAYLLDSLASIRSVALTTELDEAEKLMISFFTTLFETINPEIPRKVQIQMTEVLQHLIEENNDVPQQVLDIILLQFLKKNQSENPAAHQMAIDLCNNTTTTLQKYVCQYFNDIIIASSKQTESDKETITNLKTAHYLILELNKTASGILQNVVPQLEEELGVDESNIRSMATQVLGEMFLDKGYTLASRFPSTWSSWVRRRSDKNTTVRVMWVEHAVLMLQKQPQLAKELEEKLEDVDEKVRKAACFSFTKLEITPIVQNSISEKMLDVLGERCKDRKLSPRIEATQALSHIYDQVYDDIANGNQVSISKFGQIPSLILNLIYVGLSDITCNAEAALFGGIFGTSNIKDDRIRTERLVSVYNSLTQKAKVAFSGLIKRQSDLIFEVELLIKYASKYIESGSENKEKFEKIFYEILKRISSFFPDQEKFSNSIYKIIELKNIKIFEGILKTVDPLSDFKKVRKEQKETMRAVRDIDPELLEPLALLLKSISLTTLNKSNIVPLLEFVSGNFSKNDGRASTLVPRSNSDHFINSNSIKNRINFSKSAQDILKVTVKFQPVIFSGHVEALFDADSLTWDPNSIEDDDDQPNLTVERLYTMSMFAKLYPNLVPSSSDFFKKVSRLITNSRDIKVSKYAAAILANVSHFFSDLQKLAETIIEDLLISDDSELAPCLLAALSRIALMNHKIVDTDKCDQLFFALQSFLNGTIQMFGIISEDNKSAGVMVETEFKNRNMLSDTIKCQVYALKFLVNRVCGYSPNAFDSLNAGNLILGNANQNNTGGKYNDETSFQFNNLMKMLRKFVYNFPSSDESTALNLSAESRMHLKLIAGSGLLKLARQHRYEKAMTLADLEGLRLLVQDPSYEVRYTFVAEKLIGAISAGKISTKYIPLLFLVAHDPESEIKSLVKSFVQNRLAVMYGSSSMLGISNSNNKIPVLEESLITLIYLLSRHPDFISDDVVFSCNLFSVYINYFISIVAKSENVSLLYSLTTQLKTVRDSSVDLYLPQIAPANAVKINSSLISPIKVKSTLNDGNEIDMSDVGEGCNKLWVLTDLCLYLIQQKCSSANWTLSTSSASVYPSVLSNSNMFTKLTSEQQFVVMSASFLPIDFVKPKAANTGVVASKIISEGKESGFKTKSPKMASSAKKLKLSKISSSKNKRKKNLTASSESDESGSEMDFDESTPSKGNKKGKRLAERFKSPARR